MLFRSTPSPTHTHNTERDARRVLTWSCRSRTQLDGYPHTWRAITRACLLVVPGPPGCFASAPRPSARHLIPPCLAKTFEKFTRPQLNYHQLAFTTATLSSPPYFTSIQNEGELRNMRSYLRKSQDVDPIDLAALDVRNKVTRTTLTSHFALISFLPLTALH